MPCPAGLTSNGKISLGTIHVRGPHDLPNLAEIIRHGKMGQTRLTRNPINLFKNDSFWPVTRFDSRPDWPDLTQPACFAMSTNDEQIEIKV